MHLPTWHKYEYCVISQQWSSTSHIISLKIVNVNQNMTAVLCE